MSPVLLQASAVAKHFGGVKALRDVSLCIREGEIYGLIGPNGAGKTTFFNCLTGLYVPDGGGFTFAGEILAEYRPADGRWFNPMRLLRAAAGVLTLLGHYLPGVTRQTGERDNRGHAPHRVAERGIARTFQNIRLFANMTALENVMVGCHVRTRTGVFGAIFRTAAARAEEAAIRAKALELLHYVDIAERADDLAKNLSYGDQRRLEIARALATEPKLLCLDEPAAGMNATETEELRQLIEGIRQDGTTVLLIEHDVKLVMGLCDRVAVLDYGALVIEDVPAVVQKDQRVIDAYLGA